MERGEHCAQRGVPTLGEREVMLGIHHLGYIHSWVYAGCTPPRVYTPLLVYAGYTPPRVYTYLPTLGIPPSDLPYLVYRVMTYTALSVREEEPWAQKRRNPWVRASQTP